MWQELNPPVEWIREGLATVVEHYTIKDDKIIGLYGYRLTRLRRGIAEGNVRPFRQLLSMSFGEFASGKPGLHYAQARFLMLYLQERGLLSDFYRGYRANVQNDRTGQKLLEKLLGKPIDEIQKDVLEWTKGLKDERLAPPRDPESDN